MRGLMTDDDGLTFEYLDADEAAFLYEEIFTRRSYLRHGVHIDKAGSPVILDAGANIGLFGLLCLRENPAARIFAVEPSPAAFGCLERNLGANSAGAACAQVLLREAPSAMGHSLHCYPDAPGESTCNPVERRQQRSRLRDHVRRSAAAGTSPAAAGAEAAAAAAASTVTVVPATTVSHLLASWGLCAVDLLKIDVEGDELSVLRGIASSDWPRIRQVTCEVHDVHGRLARVLGLLRRHGMRATCELQRGGEVDGYVMVVPASLRLYYVYACRPNVGGESVGEVRHEGGPEALSPKAAEPEAASRSAAAGGGVARKANRKRKR